MAHKWIAVDVLPHVVTVDGQQKLVQATRKILVNIGKYDGDKLKELRLQQAEEAIEGQTHFANGRPIVLDRIIDLQGKYNT